MEQEYFDLYGCKENDLDLAKDQIEAALGIKLREGESTYYGKHFWYINDNDEEIDCRRNWNWDDNRYCAEEYREYPILVRIGGMSDPNKYERLKSSKVQFDLLERAKA